LFAADGTTVDALTFGAQISDVTQGRFPDGAQTIFSMPMTTPQTNNIIPNTAPVLTAITDKFVHLGQSVSFTATATDAQSAYQSLTFSLSNAPAGASINATSGAFQWTATNVIAPGTNLITVRVTDNGTPPMSDAKNFSIFISSLPQFTGVVLGGNGQFQLTFNTLLGQNYQIQYKTNLTDATWISLGGPFAGTGNPRTTSDDISGSQQRFYQVLALP
jgi:hypothetical protein